MSSKAEHGLDMGPIRQVWLGFLPPAQYLTLTPTPFYSLQHRRFCSGLCPGFFAIVLSLHQLAPPLIPFLAVSSRSR